jgi:bis(5'-nucleosyl)-tetraphosphatase (symmetrical)
MRPVAVHAIGDVQGCCDALERLLDRLRFTPGRDRLWLVGDLVNRGPRSVDVLRLVRRLGDDAVVVLGNHDLHLLALALVPGTMPKARDTLADVLRAPDRDALVDWLRRRPLLHHDPGLGATMVHAGLPPEWDLATARTCAAEVEAALREPEGCRALLVRLRAAPPERWSDTLGGLDRLAFSATCLTQLRYCDASGRIVLGFKGRPEDAPRSLLPWFRVPGRRSRHLRVVCGHWAALGHHDGDGVLAIDTGCVWGGRLTAVRLDGPPHPVAVPCRTRKDGHQPPRRGSPATGT